MRGRDAAPAILAWAGLLAALAVLLPALGGNDTVALAQLPLAAAGTVVLAVIAYLLGDRGAYDAREASVGAPAVAVGVVLAVTGGAIGLWLVLMSVPLLAAGLVALVLEARG